MKQKIEFLKRMMVVALMASVCMNLTSCGGDDDDAVTGDSGLSAVLIGTWEADYALLGDDLNTHWVINEYSDYGHVPTRVIFNSDGTFTANGMLPNGKGTWQVIRKDYKKDDCYAIVEFYQNGALKQSVRITSYKNDRKSGEVRMTEYVGRIWFKKI